MHKALLIIGLTIAVIIIVTIVKTIVMSKMEKNSKEKENKK